MANKKMSPQEILDKIRSKAKLESKEYEKSIAIKMNKSGKIRMQLLALDSDHLFKSRIQHFIPTLPDNEDPNEKIMVVDCQGDNCPICDAAMSFKNSGVTVEEINSAYKPKYPYQKVRNVFTQPEHFLLCARVLADQADEGTYLPKEESIGSTQLIQLSKTALTNLMSTYEDFVDDYDGEPEDLPSLFAIFEDGVKEAKSLTVTLRVTTQPMWSYNFTINKATDIKIEDVDVEKLKLLQETLKPTDDYMEKAINRIHQIQSYFVGGSNVVPVTTAKEQINNFVDDTDDNVGDNNLTDNLDDTDFDIDSL